MTIYQTKILSNFKPNCQFLISHQIFRLNSTFTYLLITFPDASLQSPLRLTTADVLPLLKWSLAIDIAERSKSGVLRPLVTVANGDGVVMEVGVGVFSGDIAMVMCGLSRRSPGPMARRNRTRSLQSYIKEKYCLHFTKYCIKCKILIKFRDFQKTDIILSYYAREKQGNNH